MISTPSSEQPPQVEPTEAQPPAPEEEREKVALREALEMEHGIGRLHRMGAVRSIIRNLDHEDDLVRRNLEANERELFGKAYVESEDSGEGDMARTDTMAARDVINNNHYYGTSRGAGEPGGDPPPKEDGKDDPKKPVIDLPDLKPLPGASLVKPALIGLAALAAIAGTGGLTAFLVGGQTVDLTEIHAKLEAMKNQKTTIVQGQKGESSLEIGPLIETE